MSTGVSGGAAADVVVVGAGIVGAACARALARAGTRVTVLDRGAAASATSAHGEGNLLVSDKGPGPELDLALVSLRRWTVLAGELADELGPRFPSVEHEPKGGLVVVASEPGLAGLRELAAGQRAAGVEAVEVTGEQARELEPDLAPGVLGGVHYPQDAQVQPVVATEALLASARRAGAVVRTGVEVTGGLRGADGRLVGVTTSAGDLAAGAVVVAAGPWSGEVARRLGAWVPVRPRRGTVLVTTPMSQRVHHKVYDGDYFAATQSAGAELQTSAVVESTRGGTVLIGSSREQVGFDDRPRAEVLAHMARRAVAVFPFLAQTNVMRSYLGFRPYMPDHLPVIGADPELPGLWFATGHEGAGVGLAPATGDLVAAALLGADPAVDPRPYAADRPTLSALRPDVSDAQAAQVTCASGTTEKAHEGVRP
ncbi:NAD(P)/FAD-dependent oxidoreductase [Promicromonospora thailandica]|uniref:Glycine/D-amino acid oxidase (Deaminating) n=1 Tax=Promicromonospora thailandica TaxID=765201 RepID=A0A9X2G424_9MICO|nr:FAD-dependent oxidoreductase [Promicromonospora thailandica]MCP2266710.1 Glycine/D-amino acid oxidase (deaminating) [Promicromonospora thailandica]